MENTDSGNKSAWDKAVKRLALKVNLIALFERACVPLFCAGVLAGFLTYFLRRLEIWPWYGVLGGILLVVAVFAWAGLAMRGRFFRAGDSMALLDEQLGLHGALCASSEGMGSLPGYGGPPSPYKWVSFQPFYWVVGGAAMVLLGVLLPVYGEHGKVLDIVSVPPSLTKVEDWIEELEKQDDIEDRSLDELRQQLDDLMNKPKEEMYTHSGLEAADALKAHAEGAIMEFSRNLDAVAASLSEYRAEADRGLEADSEKLMNAGLQLKNAMFKPGGELANQLSKLGANGLKNMSREEMQALMDRLKDASDCMNGMCNGGDKIADPEQYKDPSARYVKKMVGGVGRGADDAPLSFMDEASSMEGNPVEKVGSEDMSHAALGEQMGLQQGEHEKDPEQGHSLKSTNQATQPAKGGDAVWSDHISPREREALQKIFN